MSARASTSTRWKRKSRSGKQLAQEVERQAKIIDDPVIAEYVNRVGQNLVRNSDAKVPFTIKVIDIGRSERLRAAGRILLRELRTDPESR